jgi:hypothetical protein
MHSRWTDLGATPFLSLPLSPYLVSTALARCQSGRAHRQSTALAHTAAPASVHAAARLPPHALPPSPLCTPPPTRLHARCRPRLHAHRRSCLRARRRPRLSPLCLSLFLSPPIDARIVGMVSLFMPGASIRRLSRQINSLALSTDTTQALVEALSTSRHRDLATS